MRYVIAILLMTLAGVVQSDEVLVYHCKDEYNRLSFSDRPCEEDETFIGTSKLAAAPGSAAPAPPAPAAPLGATDRSVAEECEPSEDDGPWRNTFKDDC